MIHWHLTEPPFKTMGSLLSFTGKLNLTQLEDKF